MADWIDTNAVSALVALGIYGYLHDEWDGVPEGIAEQARERGIQSLTLRQINAASKFVKSFCADKRCALCCNRIESHDVIMFLDTGMCAHHAHMTADTFD